MNQQQPVNYAPFKVESDQPDRKFEVQENGDVKMTEIVKSVVWFHGREFISFQRQHTKDKEALEKSISKESIEKVKKDIETSKESIKVLSPYIKEVEINLKKTYEKQLLEGKIGGLKTELAKKKADRKSGFAEAIWLNLKDEEKSKVMKELTEKEKSEIIHFKIKQRKNSAKA